MELTFTGHEVVGDALSVTIEYGALLRAKVIDAPVETIRGLLQFAVSVDLLGRGPLGDEEVRSLDGLRLPLGCSVPVNVRFGFNAHGIWIEAVPAASDKPGA